MRWGQTFYLRVSFVVAQHRGQHAAYTLQPRRCWLVECDDVSSRRSQSPTLCPVLAAVVSCGRPAWVNTGRAQSATAKDTHRRAIRLLRRVHHRGDVCSGQLTYGANRAVAVAAKATRQSPHGRGEWWPRRRGDSRQNISRHIYHRREQKWWWWWTWSRRKTRP